MSDFVVIEEKYAVQHIFQHVSQKKKSKKCLENKSFFKTACGKKPQAVSLEKTTNQLTII